MKPFVEKVIINKVLDQRKDTIFVSAGDMEVFATFVKKGLMKDFNVIIFYYGASCKKGDFLCSGINIFFSGSGTKFNALKYLYDNDYIAEISGYIWVCDDDLVISNTIKLRDLFKDLHFYDALLASPSHSIRGKISFPHMRRNPFTCGIRESNFVEMTCPIFSTKFLKEFLSQYDYSLAGWGIDWWFSSVVISKGFNILIFDYFSVYNPFCRIDGKREIDKYLSASDRMSQWEKKRDALGIAEYNIFTKELNLGFKFKISNFLSFLFSEGVSCFLHIVSSKVVKRLLLI